MKHERVVLGREGDSARGASVKCADDVKNVALSDAGEDPVVPQGDDQQLVTVDPRRVDQLRGISTSSRFDLGLTFSDPRSSTLSTTHLVSASFTSTGVGTFFGVGGRASCCFSHWSNSSQSMSLPPNPKLSADANTRLVDGELADCVAPSTTVGARGDREAFRLGDCTGVAAQVGGRGGLLLRLPACVGASWSSCEPSSSRSSRINASSSTLLPIVRCGARNWEREELRKQRGADLELIIRNASHVID